MQEVRYRDLGFLAQRALREAEAALANAYNPYSGFSVGACLVSTTGKCIAAANVENASYGLTICAERAAIARANALSIRHFHCIAIIARGKDGAPTTEVTGPCGACRQVLYEFASLSGAPLTVVMATTNKEKIVVATIDELLPLAFGPKNLGLDLSRFKPC